MPQTLSSFEGDSFIVSDHSGDIDRTQVHGLFYRDLRYLSHFKLLVDGKSPVLLSSGNIDYYSASFYLANPRLAKTESGDLSLIRHRFVGDGLHEDLLVMNHSSVPIDLELAFEIENDFADLFEIKRCCGISKQGWTTSKYNAAQKTVTFTYRQDYFLRSTRVSFTEPFQWKDGRAVLKVKIKPKEQWKTCCTVEFLEQDKWLEPIYSCSNFLQQDTTAKDKINAWRSHMPELETDWDDLAHLFKQSLDDIGALKLRIAGDNNAPELLAAGLPWYMTIFGRDSILTAYQLLMVDPIYAKNVLSMLAENQGKEVNDAKDEQPGKILHEIRFGILASSELQFPYYGAIDATELFIILASEYWRWTGDLEFLSSIKDAILKCNAWIDNYGDLDGDGYIEYLRKAPGGIDNQGWKDSYNSVLFSDGKMAFPPIALCEPQGYVYDAKLRLAEIAEVLWNDLELAESLKQKAARLKTNFNKDFWISKKGGYFAMALDKNKRRVDSMTSNIGHLLWSGIVDEEKAESLRDKLLHPSIFTAWGLRTMSTSDSGFSPLSYHNGTIWPHDNAIAAAGLKRYGFDRDSYRISESVISSAKHFQYRLPELYASYTGAENFFPVEYPASCSPQAWSAAAAVYFITTIIGLKVRTKNGQPDILVDPNLPPHCTRLHLRNLPIAGKRFDIAYTNEKWDIREV